MMYEIELGVQTQAVAVDRIGAGERRERRLGAEQADADEAGGELHRPHVRLAQHAQVDRRVLLPQLVPAPRDEHQHPDEHDRDRDPPHRALDVDPEEREPAGDEQQAEREDDEADGVELAARQRLGLRHAEQDREEHSVTAIAGAIRVSGDVAAERREQAPAAERADDRARLERDDEVARRPGGSAMRPCPSCGRGRRSARPRAAATRRRSPAAPTR